MTSHTQPTVVVGVDGSEQSLRALNLAADEAARRHQPLRLVHGFARPVFAPQAPLAAAGTTRDVLSAVQEMLDGAAVQIQRRYPDLDVTAEVIVGGPTAVLLAESRHATMVVVGDRGHGGFTGLLVGAVATQLAAHAHCPVIVVRQGTDPSAIAATTHPVVVGVDGSERSWPAIRFAFEEAANRGVSLTAIHVWSEPPRAGSDQFKPVAVDYDQAHKEADRTLSESLAGFQERYPEVPVFRELTSDLDPARELLRATEEAALIVVGTHGRGRFAGLLLGSTGQALIHQARCPVAIVPSTP
jgi:nucleotide-binding universal stress UspA family protein